MNLASNGNLIISYFACTKFYNRGLQNNDPLQVVYRFKSFQMPAHKPLTSTNSLFF